MIKNKSELSDHIYTLIKSGELSFSTYFDWLSWGGHSDIYEKLGMDNYEQDLHKSVDKNYYLNYLNERLLYLVNCLYTNSSHSRNEVELLELKTLSKFLKKHVNNHE